MRTKVMTARPAARKGSGSPHEEDGRGRRAEEVRADHPDGRAAVLAEHHELPKKAGELPIPTATFVFYRLIFVDVCVLKQSS